MNFRLIMVMSILLISLPIKNASAYTSVRVFDTVKVVGTERAYNWLLKDNQGTAVQVIDLDGLYAQRPIKNGEPWTGRGYITTDGEHGESESIFNDGHNRYLVTAWGTCDNYPFSMSELCN